MVQINTIHVFSFLLAAIYSLNSYAVSFKFASNSIDEGFLKTKMENNISKLLNEINRAADLSGDLNLSDILMEPNAKSRLMALWEDARFICDSDVPVSKCLNDFQGYQVRNIHITMKPHDASYSGSINRELTISLNKNGVITGVRPAFENNEGIEQLLKATGSGGVTDTRMRREILKWVEDFRCYYNERNLTALNQIYSDDALILTGSVVTQRKNTGDGAVLYEQKVRYKAQNKEQYLKSLSKQFKTKKYINVEFDHISIMKHGAKPNIYGVTLHQKWRSTGYNDNGWVFLLWDFNTPETPQIHVRTWQPDQFVTTEDDLFSLDDFKIM